MLALSGLLDGIAFSFTPKSDTTAISFLAFLDGIAAIINNFLTNKIQSVELNEGSIIAQHRTDTAYNDSSVPKTYQALTGNANTSASVSPEGCNKTINSGSRFRRCGFTTLRVSNRILMVIHALLLVLSVAGAIELALTYRFANPYVFPSKYNEV